MSVLRLIIQINQNFSPNPFVIACGTVLVFGGFLLLYTMKIAVQELLKNVEG